MSNPSAIADPVPSPAPPRRRRFIRRLFKTVFWSLAIGMLIEILFVVTPVTEHLYRWLSVTQDPQPADVIVCLGGRLERLLWAARAYHQHEADRVIVSNAPGAAEGMRDMLVGCGVPKRDILVDHNSHTTAEHPIGVALLPNIDPKTTRLLIVTDHEHSRRVAAVFRKAGYQHFTIYGGPLPAWEEGERYRIKWRVQVLPRLVYEAAALVQYWFQGKI